MNTEQREKVFIWKIVYDIELFREGEIGLNPRDIRISKFNGLKRFVATASDSASEAEDAEKDSWLRVDGVVSVDMHVIELRFLGSSEVYKAKP